MATEISKMKIPPHSMEAEQSVLGSIIIDRDMIAVVMDRLRPEAFYKEAHTIIFNAVIDLFIKNEPVDMVTLTDYLDKKGVLESIGGTPYLATLIEGVPTPKNAEKYAIIVDEKYMMRRLIDAAYQISANAYNQDGEILAMVSDSEKLIYDIATGREARDVKTMKEAVKTAYDGIVRAHENRGKPIGLSSGFRGVDNLTGGFKPSELIILAARPGMGKTSFALNIAQRMALDENIPIGIFSLEMGYDQLAKRMISAEAAVDAFALERGLIVESDWQQLTRAFDRLMKAPIYIVDSPGVSPTEILAKARRMVKEFGVKFIVIDYLQLMTSFGNRSESRYSEVSEITRQLKLMARDLEIPILCLSQLSRKTEDQKGDKKPKLSHLRDSGSIEQDADIVMFIYREQYYEDEKGKSGGSEEGFEESTLAELIVAKNRNGPTGIAKLTFLKHLTRFDDRVEEGR